MRVGIATFWIIPGSEEAFEAEFRDLRAIVQEKEPGVLLYQMTRTQSAPLAYKVLEIYANEDAFEAHASSDWIKAAFPRLMALCAEKPLFETLDPLD